jgi:hypothetical protein
MEEFIRKEGFRVQDMLLFRDRAGLRQKTKTASNFSLPL